MGLTNGAANIMSIIAPLVVGFIVHDQSDPSQWRYVFFISAGIYFFGNLMFIIFSKTNVQSWNDPDHSERRKYQFFFTYPDNNLSIGYLGKYFTKILCGHTTQIPKRVTQ